MGLLEIPTELRMHIFEHLADLSYGRDETIGPNVRLTPAICRVCHTIRKETLPLYAKTSSFSIQTDDNLHVSNTRVQAWLQALGPTALSKVENLHLSKHWKLKQPSRWQGHVGFYVRLQLVRKVWQCTAGTYPIANDMRGMRLESVDLLRHVILRQLRPASAYTDLKCLTSSDVEFIINAMEIVASHPIPTFDTEQSEAGRQRRRGLWATMEGKVLALQASFDEEANVQPRSKGFHTPY
ncbi:hypothetical protein BDY17DRAFT_309761 [Neohortaea acidophila]|uniref:F-box domain-containing protein n=1 Tax=Neohortaea acidophila TaxID=245834 RepID=A0A6A6PXU5_9PEZI|nr:uncharacterized protein BDY17DRAFT_309761 [Neohortaea acidophila]KAF2484554.1 hypothetical protein BDY17DRAFT_309761 [Neohortaea acidophila]